MPPADFCRTVTSDYTPFSPDSRTSSRFPEVSSTAFGAQPPDLQPAHLMDLDFVVSCRLVLRRMRCIRLLSSGSRPCSTLLLQTSPRDDALAHRQDSTSIRLSNGLSPPSCRTCSAHKKRGSGCPLPRMVRSPRRPPVADDWARCYGRSAPYAPLTFLKLYLPIKPRGPSDEDPTNVPSCTVVLKVLFTDRSTR